MLHTITTFIKKLLPKRRGAKGDFKRRHRYSLALTNRSSLATVAELKARRSTLWILAIAAFIAIGAIWVLLWGYTPLRTLLPLKLQTDQRDEYVAMSMRLDSIGAANAVNARYAENLRAILLDTVPQSYEPQNAENSKIALDSLIEASAAERSFVNRFESSERFNLSVLSPIAAEGMTFYPPMMGIEYTPRVSESGIPYLLFSIGRASSVSAIYRGTVVNVLFTTTKGITVVIQHPNDFMSQYSGLAEAFVVKGEKVNAGTRIGLAMGSQYPFTFEMWHNGSPLAPEEYINF